MTTITIPAPQVLLAEVTHRCPLQCPYCSNPTELIKKDVEISTDDWARVFKEAADLGVLQVSISGGEPAARRDLTELIRAARDADLYVNLITSGIGITKRRLDDLVDAGCDHIQLSLQDVDSDGAKLISNLNQSLERKLEFANWVTEIGVPLTINAVMHRLNLDRLPETIELAQQLGARRLEIANVQYHGWASLNKHVLMPTQEQSDKTNQIVADARVKLQGQLLIDYVPVDGYEEKVFEIQDKMSTRGGFLAWLGIMFLAGFTPLPFKVFTITSGVIGFNLSVFFFICLFTRGLRFFLVSYLTHLFGKKFGDFIEKRGALWFTVTGIFIVILAAVLYIIFVK